MTKQNLLYFSVKEFLDKVSSKQHTPEEMAELLSQEIERVEGLKIMLIEEQQTGTIDAIVNITQKIDAYIIKLQAVLSELPLNTIRHKIYTSTEVRQVRDKILQKLGYLNQAE